MPYASDKRRKLSYYWPTTYPLENNKLSIRTIANELIAAGKADTTTFGGFASTESAAAGRSQLWNLAEVLYDVVQHGSAMAGRCMDIPKVFVDIAGQQCTDFWWCVIISALISGVCLSALICGVRVHLLVVCECTDFSDFSYWRLDGYDTFVESESDERLGDEYDDQDSE